MGRHTVGGKSCSCALQPSRGPRTRLRWTSSKSSDFEQVEVGEASNVTSNKVSGGGVPCSSFLVGRTTVAPMDDGGQCHSLEVSQSRQLLFNFGRTTIASWEIKNLRICDVEVTWMLKSKQLFFRC